MNLPRDELLAGLEWIITQAESAMAITAGCANTSGDPEGGLQMTNSIASDIAINAQMLFDKLLAAQEPTGMTILSESLLSRGDG